jgi:hypothetical protein
MNVVQLPPATLKVATNAYSGSLWPNASPSVEWAAGFLDGEGCIHIAKQTFPAASRRKPIYRLRVCVTQNNREVLEHFRETLGVHGNLYRVARTAGQNRQNYVLIYDGRFALALISSVGPHLVRKRPEADVAMLYWFSGAGGVRFGSKGVPPDVLAIRERCYRKLQRLK